LLVTEPYYQEAAIRSPEALEFVQWLGRSGLTEPWQAYDRQVRARYARETVASAATMAEIQRVMEDPWFGVIQ